MVKAISLVGTLLAFFCEANGLFTENYVEYKEGEKGDSEIVLKEQILTAEKTIASSDFGKKLLDCVRGLFTQYSEQHSYKKTPKIVVQLGDKTAFFPSSTTSSPSVSIPSAQNVLEQERILTEINETSEQISTLLQNNKQLIADFYEAYKKDLKLIGASRSGPMCRAIEQAFDKIPEDAEIKPIIVRIKELKEKEREQRAALHRITQQAQQTEKNWDLIITIDKRDITAAHFMPGCVYNLQQGILITPTLTPFFIILSHELLHMKHYLEEQKFKTESLSSIARYLFANKEGFIDLGSFESEEDALDKLVNISTIRDAVLDRCSFAGNNDLLWKLDKLDSLAILAYSSAGNIKGNNNVVKTLLPEAIGRSSELLLDLIGDLEERRTIVGPDRDGITENAIRKAMSLPLRYMYQDGLLPMLEKKTTIASVLGNDSLAYIQENPFGWKMENMELHVQEALRNKLSVYKKAE